MRTNNTLRLGDVDVFQLRIEPRECTLHAHLPGVPLLMF